MSTKHCNTCNTTKAASEFHLRAASKDGLAARCRECQREYDRSRLRDPKRVQARREYQRGEAGKLAHRAASLRYYQRHPERRAAQVAVGNALRDGRLARKPCEACGDPKAEAHHDDYTKPLDVRWLCDEHHKQHHHTRTP